MSAVVVRLKKEARAIFWPWCAVLAAGLLPLVLHFYGAKSVNLFSFFFGVPLLATLSMGNEFYHRTISLWLTQPASRFQLWAEKMLVMCAAVLSAALVSGAVMYSRVLTDEPFALKLAAAAFVILVMASANYWALTARSTLGALLLLGFILDALYWIVEGTHFLPHWVGGRTAASTPASIIAGISVSAISLACLMLWLGARKLARFQATGVTSGEDLLMSGPSVMPDAFAAWYRCRPDQPLLNLVRREFRLLRPVWLIELPVMLYMAVLGICHLLPTPPVEIPHTALSWVLLAPAACVCIGMAGLAGMLSVGEEKTSGTHAWQMALPIPPRRQWLVKLAVALPSGLACSVLFPVLAMVASGRFNGSPWMYVDLPMVPNWIILYSILCFSCFWCACAANGTVRAVAWSLPAMTLIVFSSARGVWLGEQVARVTGTLKDFLLSSFHLSPFAYASITGYPHASALWLFIPTLLFALFQSYYLFRAQPRGRTLWMLRCLAPLVGATFLWSFSVTAGAAASAWQPFDETRHALDTLQFGGAKLEFTGDDLAKGFPLTAPTQRWLAGSSITIAPNHSDLAGYLATIHLASGVECKLIVTRYGGSAGSCAN